MRLTVDKAAQAQFPASRRPATCEMGLLQSIEENTGMLDVQTEAQLTWIKKGLEKAGKTQRGMARVLGTDPAAITRLMKGGRRLRAGEVPKLATYFGVPVPPADFGAGPSPEHLNIDVSKELLRVAYGQAMKLDITLSEYVERAVRAAISITEK